MKMNKKTNLVIISLFMLMITTLAVTALMPLVISGETDFNGVIYAEAEIEITDNSGNTWYAYTSDNGVYTIDAGNLQRNDMSYVKDGDTLNLKICPETISGCLKTVKVSSNPVEVNFGVAAEPVIKPVTGATVITTITPTETKDCEACEVCKDCNEGITAGISSLIAFLTGVVGIYYFKRKDAKMPNGTFVKFGGAGPLHFHRGLKGYHDPKTSHRVIKERHPKGELDPCYEKDANGVYVYKS